jgi:hypothetical protein
VPGAAGSAAVRLEDTTWLDVLTWRGPDGEQRLMERAAEFDAVSTMHDLLVDVEEPLRGEILHTSPR